MRLRVTPTQCGVKIGFCLALQLSLQAGMFLLFGAYRATQSESHLHTAHLLETCGIYKQNKNSASRDIFTSLSASSVELHNYAFLYIIQTSVFHSRTEKILYYFYYKKLYSQG